MRIGIDARLVWPGLGIAQFVTGLVKHLADSAEVIWFGDPALAPHPVKAVRVDRLPHPMLDLPGARVLARREGIDVMHFTANTGWMTPGRPPFVLTVHDLQFMDTPIGGRSLRQVIGHRYARHNVVLAAAAASVVATPSVASASDTSERVRLARGPVVIPNGVDLVPAIAPPSGAAHPIAGNEGYALAFSARDPRKGVELAVAGWRAAGRRPRELWLMAGAGLPPGLEDEIAGEVTRGEIRVLPYVARDRLHEILAGARALIYPSSAEGFGLPVLEAMATGLPVLTGLTPATREIGADAVLRLDADDPVASIAAGLRLLADDACAGARLAEAGRRRAQSYSWQACARAYLDLYLAAAEG